MIPIDLETSRVVLITRSMSPNVTRSHHSEEHSVQNLALAIIEIITMIRIEVGAK